MRFPRFKTLLCPLLAVAVFFTSLGLSPGRFVISTNSGDGVWYPCIDHGCGCLDAASCANGCCCYPAEAVETDKEEGSGGCCAGGNEVVVAEAVEVERVEISIRSAACSGVEAAWLMLRDVAPWRVCDCADVALFEVAWFDLDWGMDDRLPCGVGVSPLDEPPRA